MPHGAVVRVYATVQEFDYDAPWQSLNPTNSSGSGVLVAPGRVLTGAHVVADATFLRVQKIDDPNKYVATVCGVCHDADLALLQIDDSKFMAGIQPAEIGNLPSLRDRVSVVGYPIGGEEISVTEGVVSRVEAQTYTHSERELLAVTVDAAINDGSSGGPVFVDDKVAGIAFQSWDDAENIGEMVPTPIIKRFLAGVESGRPPHVPSLGIRTQTLENPALRRATGIGDDRTGVLIRSVEYGGSAWRLLEPGDVLLAVDGQPIANNATISFRRRYRTSFVVVLGEHFVGDVIPVRVLRGGSELEIPVELKPQVWLVPRSQYDRSPTWFVFGGLVFQILTLDYLSTWNEWWKNGPKELVYEYYWGLRTPERQEMVILTQILADELNIGYEDLHNESIVAVNGRAPVDMRDFVAAVDGCDGELEIRTSLGGRIVLDAAAAREGSPRILERYHIVGDRSSDLETDLGQ